jgi:hypothetical protein
MDKMAIEWCSKVDDINIFPKLPVYLRIHFASWTHNQQVKETVKNVALGQATCDKINDRTLQMVLSSSPTRKNNIASITPATPVTATPNVVEPPPITNSPFLPVMLHPTIAEPASSNLQSLANPTMLVGGFNTSLVCGTENIKRKNGERSKDKKQRKRRTCLSCFKDGRIEQAKSCPGRLGQGTCSHYNNQDNSK